MRFQEGNDFIFSTRMEMSWRSGQNRGRRPTASDDASPSPQIILVQDWFEELQRLVPTP